MVARADITLFSAAAATASACGVLLGVWASPPAELTRPAMSQALQPTYAEDPNLVRYRQVIAEQGGPGPLFLVRASTIADAGPPSNWVDENRALEAEIAREEAAFQERSRVWEAERIAWLEAHAQPPPVQPGAYPLQRTVQPIEVRLDTSEAEPAEQPTAAYAPAERPPEARDP